MTLLKQNTFTFWATFLLATLFITACTPQELSDTDHDDHDHENEGGTLLLPELEAADLTDRKLNVVATTNIIGDIVDNIGHDAIELTTLLTLNQDPHSYEATPSDLVALEQADIIFINGWDLEEQLAHTIEENYPAKFVSISAGIEPLTLGSGDSADPHVWFSIHNVEQWAKNVEHILHQLDPESDELFEENLEQYLTELEQLEQAVDELLVELPTSQRKLVTNHDAFGYLAAEYDFEIVGTIIPAASTSAEPSARDLTDLIETMEQEGVCTVFAETTQNNQLAETVAAELDGCEEVAVVSLYTGSLGEGEADNYVGMFWDNIEKIVTNLNK
ncbi:MAG: metal ABC transporter substrate-binding protein [Anaerolineae bacterium]